MRTVGLLLGSCLLLYAPSLGRFFVSDDFVQLERNELHSFTEALAFFSARGMDFYRPIPRLHFGLLQLFFGDRALAWNLTGILLHGLVSVVAGALAVSLLGKTRVRAAQWTGLFFAIHFIHVEPVVWASSVTSLYAGFFVLLALLSYRRARTGGAGRDRALSVAAFAAALLSKETAIALLPLLALVSCFEAPAQGGRGRLSFHWPGMRGMLPYALLLAAYLVIVSSLERGGEASPYRWILGAHVFKNAAFFVLGCFLPLRYWRLRDLWVETGGGAGLLGRLLGEPSLAVPLVAGALVLAVLFVRGSREIRWGFLWILAAATPFLLLPGSGERFLYLPSFGACLILGIGAERLLAGTGPSRGRWMRRAVLLGLLLLHVGGSWDRQRDWITASRWTRAVVDQWSELRPLGGGRPIEFAGIPGSYRSAWVFRNGFESMVRLYWQGRPYRLARPGAQGEGQPGRIEVQLLPDGTLRWERSIGPPEP